MIGILARYSIPKIEGCLILQDLTGARYGRLTALSYAGRNKHCHSMWSCKCDCGSELGGLILPSYFKEVNIVKYSLIRNYCLVCDWEKTTKRELEGWDCPSCRGPIMYEKVDKNKTK